MTNYSLRARMMILILAPTVLIGLLLSIFFVAHRYNDLQRQLEDAGASIIEPLAVSSEYGMNLQNRESIGQLISVLHRRHSEIVRAISVYDSHNRLFVTSNYQLNPSELQIPKGEVFPRHLSVIRDGDMMILRTPIVSESYSPDESPESDAKMPGNMLGYVALELDLKSVRLQQYKEIFISSVMMLFWDSNAFNADFKSILLKRAAQSLLLIDKSKFNRSGEARIGHLDDVTHIVSDAPQP